MSPFMAAVVAYVLGESWTDPAIVEITVSEAEDLVYIRKAGSVGGLAEQLQSPARRGRPDGRRASRPRTPVRCKDLKNLGNDPVSASRSGRLNAVAEGRLDRWSRSCKKPSPWPRDAVRSAATIRSRNLLAVGL